MLTIWNHSILPQVFPAMADVTFYRWEYNFRASMVVGAVGAGGIGLEIISALRIMDYAQVSALLNATAIDLCDGGKAEIFTPSFLN